MEYWLQALAVVLFLLAGLIGLAGIFHAFVKWKLPVALIGGMILVALATVVVAFLIDQMCTTDGPYSNRPGFCHPAGLKDASPFPTAD